MTETVRDATTKELGPLELRNNVVIADASGKMREIDGLLVNSSVAIVIEAKHAAQRHHVQRVQDKADFLAGVARQGGFPLLAGIRVFMSVLASTSFSPLMVKLCHANNVGVVKSYGLGHTYFPARGNNGA